MHIATPSLLCVQFFWGTKSRRKAGMQRNLWDFFQGQGPGPAALAVETKRKLSPLSHQGQTLITSTKGKKGGLTPPPPKPIRGSAFDFPVS